MQGVMLSHSAVISEVSSLHAFLKQIGDGNTVSEEDVVLSYLPLAHVFDRCELRSYLARRHSSTSISLFSSYSFFSVQMSAHARASTRSKHS